MKVLYAKNPLSVYRLAVELRVDPKECILLHLDNKEEWKNLLEGVEVEVEGVVGINLYELQKYGAKVPDPIKDFSPEELFFILYEKYKNPETPINEIIAITRNYEIKTKRFTPVLEKFNNDLRRIIKAIEKKIYKANKNNKLEE